MKKLRDWMEKMCDENYEPAWQEPLEWMLIGALIMLIILGFAMGVF